jgi:hypothetical protein
MILGAVLTAFAWAESSRSSWEISRLSLASSSLLMHSFEVGCTLVCISRDTLVKKVDPWPMSLGIVDLMKMYEVKDLKGFPNPCYVNGP